MQFVQFWKQRTGRLPAELVFDSKLTTYAHLHALNAMGIADSIDFFHMDALSSAVPMKINCDLQLTVMASGRYRLLASKIAHGYQRAKSRHLFRDFIDASALVRISAEEITVQFQKRAHNPLLLAAGIHHTDTPIPWLAGRRLRLAFG